MNSFENFTHPNGYFSQFLSLAEAFTATWTKFYCTYKKQEKQFAMLPYNQISGRTEQPAEYLTLVQCTRRASDFEKRFCFDLTFHQKPGLTFTFQALSEEDRKTWLNAMDGKEPVSANLWTSYTIKFTRRLLISVQSIEIGHLTDKFFVYSYNVRRHIWHRVNPKPMKSTCWTMLGLRLPANASKSWKCEDWKRKDFIALAV